MRGCGRNVSGRSCWRHFVIRSPRLRLDDVKSRNNLSFVMKIPAQMVSFYGVTHERNNAPFVYLFIIPSASILNRRWYLFLHVLSKKKVRIHNSSEVADSLFLKNYFYLELYFSSDICVWFHGFRGAINSHNCNRQSSRA